MDKIHKLILAVIPNQCCNLKCEYCYISQVNDWNEKEEMQYTPEHIAKCLSIKRLGGIALINLTGNGETMLQSNIVEIIKYLLLEGHYVEVVTNGTVKKRFREILELPKELLERLFFKISFHYKELKRLGLLESFYDTVRLLKKNNIAFSLELMAYDKIEENIDEIIESCNENVGAICQATVGRADRKRGRDLLSEHTESDYKLIWSKLDSPMQKFKLNILGVKRHEFCYAGAWSLLINLYTGKAKSCYRQPYSQNIFEDVNQPIIFRPVGYYCLQPYCINGHSHLTWGLIPELETPCYLEMRNRVCKDGTQWINNKCKDFFQTRLYDSNKQFSLWEKMMHIITFPPFFLFYVLQNIGLNTNRIKKFLKIWNSKH